MIRPKQQASGHKACLIGTQFPCRKALRSSARRKRLEQDAVKRNPVAHTVRAFLLGSLLFGASEGNAHAEWQFYFDAGLLHDDNLSRASHVADVRGDSALFVAASAGRVYAPTGSDGLTLSVQGSAEAYDRYNGLNRLELGAAAAWRHKFGLGYLAPWMVVAAAALHDDYRSDIRDSSAVRLQVETGRRFNAAFDASFGATLDRRYAANDVPEVPGISGKVFDLSGRSIFMRAGYAISDRLLLGVRADVRRGDVVSTSEQDQAFLLASSAIAEDPSFGDDLYDYRLRGTTCTGSASASWALSDETSLNLSYADQRTRAQGGLDYRSRSVRLSITYGY